MIPQYERLGGKEPLIKLPTGKVAVAVVSLPLFSFIFCVLWSVLFYFERATDTHCHVFNFLPSISAAIGNYQPQRFVWQLAITLHAPGRFMFAIFQHRRCRKVLRRSSWCFLFFATFLNVIENLALLGLTYFTSVDSYATHKFFFITFIATSELFMLLSWWLNKYYARADSITPMDLTSVQFKGIFCAINVISFAMAGYFFMRHNSLCEPGVYSLFAMCEYVVVLTNMAFHMTAYWDFWAQTIIIDNGGLYLSLQ